MPLAQLQHLAPGQRKWIRRRKHHPRVRLRRHAQRAHHVEKVPGILLHVDVAVRRNKMLIVGAAVHHQVALRHNLARVVVVGRVVRVHDVVAVVNHHIAVQRIEVALREARPRLRPRHQLDRNARRRLRDHMRFRQNILLAGIVGQVAGQLGAQVVSGMRRQIRARLPLRIRLPIRRPLRSHRRGLFAGGKLRGYGLRLWSRMTQQDQRDTPKQAGSHCARHLQHSKAACWNFPHAVPRRSGLTSRLSPAHTLSARRSRMLQTHVRLTSRS